MARQGRPPSVREIARHFGMASPRAASDHLAALERKGYLRRSPRTARGLELLQTRSRGLPVVGRVAAGAPIEALEHVDEELDLGAMAADGRRFAVRVVGESMRDAGIRDGDYVIVEKDARVENGKMAVAYIDGEATVKWFERTAKCIRLLPDNPEFAPIVVDDTTPDFRLAGPVVGVIRLMKR